MEKEDKIAFSAILIVLCAVIFGLMWGVKVAGTALFGWFDAADAGVSFKDALVTGVVLSTILLVLFALVAGDGVVGELPSMLVGFFLLTLFFTVSIAWIY